MEVIYTEIDYLVTLPEHCGGAGDIAPAMALGSVEAARACADRVWGSPSLQGRSVALQGLGAVGANALALFIEHGTHVVVSDVDEKKVANAVATYGVSAVATDDIYDQDVDIFAPYALGGIINPETIPRLKAKIVAGSANNIFADEERDAATLGAPNGVARLIVDRGQDAIVGVHLVGPLVSELAGEAAIAVEMGASAEDMAGTIHPHPTISESLHEAALMFVGRALHVSKDCSQR